MMYNNTSADRATGHCTVAVRADEHNEVYLCDNGDSFTVCCTGGATETYTTYEEAYKAFWRMYDIVKCVCQHEQNVKHGWHNMLAECE